MVNYPSASPFNHNHNTCDLESFDDIYVSMCLINKNCLKQPFISGKAIVILGMDDMASLEYFASQSRLPELDIFGNAPAEKYRVEIVDFIGHKEKIIIMEIEQELDFTGNNAYYHLSPMIKAGMLRTRNPRGGPSSTGYKN